MSLTNTTYPSHTPASYVVEEHDLVTCPPDLWPLIKAYLARNALREAA